MVKQTEQLPQTNHLSAAQCQQHRRNRQDEPPPPASQPGSKFRSCWSCRLVSGGGLILAGAYVFMEARNVMRRCGTTSMGTVAQITFAASLAAWGIVIVADPVGKAQRKDVGTPST
ncbi:distal membrane-arm assembly complex protein 1-like [Hippoglossus hippoglossus]|uniref:distal membrane-arm assembly complex protein 1-like n=1 Tax=Hippoglossus hippoglossus TaxID=8267 RepID=UPI00148B84E6|nr:distal membrane-arm assembly complex protein 1-like [Hippoglossus hippoglossus]